MRSYTYDFPFDNELRTHYDGKRIGDKVTNHSGLAGYVIGYDGVDTNVLVLWLPFEHSREENPRDLTIVKYRVLSAPQHNLFIDLLHKRGYYNPWSVFHHAPTFYIEPSESRYEYRAEIVKWNTRSARLVCVGISWNDKRSEWILSHYKTGSTKRAGHGENMRSRSTKLKLR
ncbi:MAG: hypothetical protein V4450_07330 [Bacteroidota bacterium]